MKRLIMLTWGCLGITVLALGMGFLLGGNVLLSVGVLALGLIWGLSKRQGWLSSRFEPTSVLLVCFILVAASGFLLGVWPGWLVLGAGSTLAAWDLEFFARRIGGAALVMDEGPLIQRHLSRLGIVVGVGSGLAILALVIRFRFGFNLSLLLGLLVVLGLSQGVRLFKQIGE